MEIGSDYLRLGSFGRLGYKIKSFVQGLTVPLKDTGMLIKRGAPRVKAVAVCAYIPGVGRIIAGDIFKGVLYAAYFALYLWFMIAAGCPAFAGGGAFSGGAESIGIIIALILSVAAVYLYFRHASGTVKRARNTYEHRPHAPSMLGGLAASVVNSCLELKSAYARTFGKTAVSSPDTAKTAKSKAALVVCWLFPGLAQALHKQFIKGGLFIAITALYAVYMILSGGGAFSGFVTLKTVNQLSTYNLVYGLIAIMFTLAFAAVYVMNVKAAADNQKLLLAQKPIPDFKNEIKSLNGSKFYILLLLIPVVGALVFTVLPLLFMVTIAFTDYSTLQTIPKLNREWLSWTGLAAFKSLFANTQFFASFMDVFGWTIVWAVLATFSCYFGGMLMAMLINKKVVKAKVLWRSIFMLTMAIPQLVSLRTMYAFFHDQGALNSMLMSWGWISERIQFWGTENLAKTLIIFINMWVGIPYFLLMMSGLLMNIPEDLYEYGRTEGASKWYMFRKITMPYLLFMTAPLLITNFVSNINNFNVIWLLTGGGPGADTFTLAGGTDILITWLYKLTMQNNPRYNLGSAVGIIMFIMSATISLIVYRSSSSYKREGEFA